MAIVFNSKFESDLSGWSSTVSGTGGAIEHDTTGLAGTAGLAKFSYTANTTAAFLERTFTNTATVLRSRFYLDQTNVSLPFSSNAIYIWQLRAGTGEASRIAGVQIRRDVSDPRLVRLVRWNDSATLASTDVDISTLVPEWIEIRATKSSTDATSDATLTMYFGGGDFNPNGEQVAQLTGFLSWAKFEAVDRVRIGMTVLNVNSISASELLQDEVVLRDDDTPIGPVSAEPDPVVAQIDIPAPPHEVSIFTGDTVNFEGQASGGTAPYVLDWFVRDSGESLMTSYLDTVSGSHQFNTAGTFFIDLVVTDDAAEESDPVRITVTVASSASPLAILRRRRG